MNIIHEKDLKIFSLPIERFENLNNSSELFDVILLAPPFDRAEIDIPFKFSENKKQTNYLEGIIGKLNAAISHLNKNGSIIVYSIPRWLPYFAEYLSQELTFKYWIAIKNPYSITNRQLIQPFHEGAIVFVKNKNKFTLNKVRYPHIFCSQCGDYLADWGGKKHLRPKYGPVISDVWDDRDDLLDTENGLGLPAVERLLELTCQEKSKVLFAMNSDKNTFSMFPVLPESDSTNILINSKNKFIVNRNYSSMPFVLPKKAKEYRFKEDEVFIGDSIEIMSAWISNQNARFDLIFADPPYNLEKDYGEIGDNLIDREYISWCDQWLVLCSKLLKPHGTLYVLNLPKWSYFHATLLSKILYFQRWIAWDALSDPRGNVMPAHYSLLMYTNHPSRFTYNRIPPIPKMDQCFRSKCISSRPSDSPTEELSDIWFDVHRIKHKRDRDEHPCQLPEKLLDRVINISSNPGDTVFDPFLGTGTTAVMAHKLGRHYVGLDIDPKYRKIAKLKIDAIDFQQSQSNSALMKSHEPSEHQLILFE